MAINTSLDLRNSVIVIAESLAIVIAAIRITSAVIARPKTQEVILTDLASVVLRLESRDWQSLVQRSDAFVPHGTAEWLARVDRVH